MAMKSSKGSVTHSNVRRAMEAVEDRLIEGFAMPMERRFVHLPTGERLRVFESGVGDPVLLLHGTGSIGLDFLPLVEHLPDRRVITWDRPGHGLSDPVEGLHEDHRGAAVRVITQLLDALGIEEADLIGNSGGGMWMFYTALDEPDRVRRMTSIGATPMLPGTKVPFGLKLMATPGVGQLLSLVMPQPTPRSMIRSMAMFGEGESIVNYPELVDGYVATGRDPVAQAAARVEITHAVAGLRGIRPLLTEAVLASISQPVLLLWGENDPVGSIDAAHTAASCLPNAEVVILPTGHSPWLGEPDRCGRLITTFLNKG
jgi:pimeloyl-ACP methyl ester carboxylesterase